MLVPKISSSTTIAPELRRAIGLLPSALFTSAADALAATADTMTETSAWADVSADDNVVDLLNSGLSVAVFAADSQIPADCDKARTAIRYTATNDVIAVIDQAVASGITCAGAVILELTSEQLSEATQKDATSGSSALSRLTKAADSILLGTSGPVRVLVELQVSVGGIGGWTVDLLSQVAKAGADVVIPADVLALSGDDSGAHIPLAEAFVAGSGLTSDRADGLFTTVVVDEQCVCLGVVYSSVESIAAALTAGEGVYWSRRRGLWHKGLTSGATQTLVGINVDCDSDALCFRVQQNGAGFCHHSTRSCFGPASGLSQLAQVVTERKRSAPEGSYTARLFSDAQLLRAKLLEEATELAEATRPADVAFEAADLLYFAMVKCATHGVTLADVERSLDLKHRKVVRRPGNAKPEFAKKAAALGPSSEAAPLPRTSILSADIRTAEPGEQIRMRLYDAAELTGEEHNALLQRPIIDSEELMGRVRPIVSAVRANGDAAIREFTRKFDRVDLDEVVLRAPFPEPQLSPKVREAIDQAYSNIHKFHAAQLGGDISVETMPGVTCARFSRAIERVGLYVPGGTAVLPSSALMLGVPAQVAGCSEIVLATPPRSDGSIVPEVLYVAHKVGATAIVKAGGAQAIAAMAYGTETVPKVDKICGPGNQYVTAAKMLAQNDTAAMVSIDMPAGPSEVLVIADSTSNPAYVASDLLSQAEHGPDSQVVLLAAGITDAELAAIEEQVHEQASRLPRVAIVRQSIPKSYCLRVASVAEAIKFSNAYAPEHLILHNDRANTYVKDVINAGSVFVGPYSPESCGDYASGTNHTLPTYGFSRMYSGVNTATFVKHITSQELTREGLANIGQTVMALAEVEELEAHRNAVAIRLRDL
ncbi:trifunctional histidinol dehydrogenase [Coemansia interrupta]|uniref:Histidine biosynthesis trifunctional protein n=1 Tax=Coemansia interrupta TaxID=1126814 RepID=A0A9W8LKV3_9FUNG|nr:trifunctional histidinol dehydrogenase [Coemansia interrupta]